MKKIGVVRFPGTNCDRDVLEMAQAKGFSAQYLWHLDQFEGSGFAALILPGGFSYGDYLRSGALAARSPVMKSVAEFAQKGGPVLGICNGFQILTEAGLLPGALVQNENRRFIDDWTELEVINEHQQFGQGLKGQSIRLPVAHGDGRYFAQGDLNSELHEQGLIWMKYKTSLNGSISQIAGVFNRQKNVAGLMPHPERALYPWMGGVDGWSFL